MNKGSRQVVSNQRTPIKVSAHIGVQTRNPDGLTTFGVGHSIQTTDLCPPPEIVLINEVKDVASAQRCPQMDLLDFHIAHQRIVKLELESHIRALDRSNICRNPIVALICQMM